MLLRAAGRSLLESPAVGASTTNVLNRCPRRGLATEDVWKDQSFDAKLGPMLYRREKEASSKNARTGHRGTALPEEKKRLLTPYELSKRVKVLCDKGNLKEAITKLKESPRDAQNAIVWGTLIHEVMKAEKYKEGYRLFIDMKRRGFSPTTRTYSTILGGYSSIDDWELHPVQLDNVYTIYTQLQRHHEEITRNNPHSSELSDIPYTQLITIFGKAQQFQRMYDVFNALPSEGPLAPSIHTYTALLNAISRRKASSLVSSVSILSEDGEEEKRDAPSHHELMFKNSTDARLIWRELVKASTKSAGLEIDSHALRALLKILGRGRPSDQNFAFDIINEYFGLSKPGQQAIPPKVELHPLTLEALLAACNSAKRYNLTLHYVQQVIDSDYGSGPGQHPLGLRRMLDTRHMDIVMEAHAARASLGSDESEDALETLEWMHRMQAIGPAPGKDGGIGPQIRPTSRTYDLVLLTCWRSGDWKVACRTFELMTGYGAAQFRGDMHGTRQPERRSKGRSLTPTPSFMTSLLRTASKTHISSNLQQALNIFEHYGWNTFFTFGRPNLRLSPTQQKERKDKIFYAPKLAQALTHLLPAILELPKYNQETKARWTALHRRAESKTQDHSWGLQSQ